jgi:hypothetical protein
MPDTALCRQTESKTNKQIHYSILIIAVIKTR